MKVISACLVGVNCNYKASNSEEGKFISLVEKGQAIPICPEQLGGLTTPRVPAEIVGDKVVTKDGDDVTSAFSIGANEVLQFCQKMGVKQAILKSKSPSCGCGSIYDGTFSGKLITGDGVTTRLLKENGIEVINSEEWIK